MRQHIGFHIIKGDILPEPTTCGFCGLIGCHISIEKTTVGFLKPFSSDCKFYKPFNLKSSIKCTSTYPCTNIPVECNLCNGIYWSYNIESHFKISHNNNASPILITEKEMKMVLDECI